MPTMKLTRRTCLRGMGGISLALPTLEAMLDANGTAYADGSPLPRRHVVCFGGYSIGSGDGKGNVTNPQRFVPDKEGADYDLKPALEPFGTPLGTRKQPVKNEISVVSGLLIPWIETENVTDPRKIPPGGRAAEFHGMMMSPLLTGTRSWNGLTGAGGPTSDQVVADSPAAGGTRFKSLQFAIQASDYYYGNGVGSVSARRSAAGACPFLAPQDKPRRAWQNLFRGFAPGLEEGAEAQRQFTLLQKHRRSVLDIVLGQGRVSSLLGRVGAADRNTLDDHFQNLRALEKQIDTVSPRLVAGCERFADPGPDEPAGTPYRDHTVGLSATQSYSGEKRRAEVFVDLVHMALVCDLTRVISLVFTEPQSTMNMYPILGDKMLGGPNGMHGLTHSYSNAGLAQGIAWHMSHFANLVAKLRDTAAGAGSVLDSSVLLFLCEGGFGRMAGQTPDNLGDQEHSTENMAVLVAGRAGGLNPGRHIRARGKHPAQVLISAMNAVGVDTDTLGEVKGNLPELFGGG